MFVLKSTYRAAQEANAALIKRNGELLLQIEELKASRPGRGARGRYVAVREGKVIRKVRAGEQG